MEFPGRRRFIGQDAPTPDHDMGRPRDDRHGRMTPAEQMRAGRRAWRVLLSALAGSGLTAVTVGGPLSSKVFGATGSKPHTSGSVPLAVSETGTATQESGAGTPPGSTQTTSTSTTPTTSTETTTTAPPRTSTGPLVVKPAPESHRPSASAAPT